MSPVPAESGQRLSQSGCFYGLAALSLRSSNYVVYFGNKNVLFDDTGQESSPAFPSTERGGEASDQKQAVMSYRRQAQGHWGQKGHRHTGL